ncbi:MAG: hypothetical protein AABX35_00950 [Nanoarchaeota archaeon]
MRLQKQLASKVNGKEYHKYVIVLSDNVVQEAGLKEGDELESSVSKGEVRLRKK